MLEPDTQIVPPRGSNHETEARPERPSTDPVLLRRWVGRYELIHRLAHGGMATVYLGRAKGKAGFEKVVAVKVIHPHLAGEAEFVRMFLDEARIAARIHHPHVVEILDLGESNDAYFMVMEFIEGENLAALTRALDGERLPIPVTLQIIADTLEGLNAAHELKDADGRPYKLVHRDVSPHNILINLDGWSKVADFGIMKASGKASNTKTGELRGKLAYMSPEQARGIGVDHRTDLFAVGVILWELLTGKRLFARPTEAATLERVIHCEVPSLASSGVEQVTPAAAEALQALVDTALASDTADRPRDAAAMLTEVKRLQRLMEELPGGEPRAYLGELMGRFFRRRVDYARAALRQTGEHKTLDDQSSELLVEPTIPVARTPTRPGSGSGSSAAASERTPSGPIPQEIPQTGSNPVLAASGTALAQPTGLAQWSMWVLLPMLGAGIAIAAMLVLGPRFDRGSETGPADPAPQPAPEPDLAPTSLVAREYQPVARRPTPSGQVRWYFSTSPRGARVVIDGEAQGSLTPTWVYLPIGDEPLDIRIELDGYEPRTMQLPAVHDQTFSETLELVTATTQAAEPESTPSKRVRNPKPKTGTTGENTDGAAGTPGAIPNGGGTGFLPVPDSLRDGSKTK